MYVGVSQVCKYVEAFVRQVCRSVGVVWLCRVWGCRGRCIM